VGRKRRGDECGHGGVCGMVRVAAVYDRRGGSTNLGSENHKS
jgi:hypothetical protein